MRSGGARVAASGLFATLRWQGSSWINKLLKRTSNKRATKEYWELKWSLKGLIDNKPDARGRSNLAALYLTTNTNSPDRCLQVSNQHLQRKTISGLEYFRLFLLFIVVEDEETVRFVLRHVNSVVLHSLWLSIIIYTLNTNPQWMRSSFCPLCHTRVRIPEHHESRLTPATESAPVPKCPMREDLFISIMLKL